MTTFGRNEPVFMLSEVARVLGMPESRVKNWTIGRPLLIKPLVPAYGTGTRNVYSVYDIYRMAIAKHMNASGATARAIQAVVDKVGTSFGSSVFAVVEGQQARKGESEFEVSIVYDWGRRATGLKQVIRKVANSRCCYVVNLHKIVQDVESLVDHFLTDGPRGSD
jgi:hypothetical protein